MMHSKNLHTVCEEAACPNMGECWNSGTATFLILGDVCTRRCGFCDIKHGKPQPIDPEEPERVALAVKDMRLRHAVITSVDRDDDNLGGARIFASVIRLIRHWQPGCSVEVLIPDFQGDPQALRIVMAAHPEILNHNLETVPRLFPSVQPSDKLEWSQAVLTLPKKLDPRVLTKSGLMVGLGETTDELHETMRLLREWDVDILTIGQYLQPSRSTCHRALLHTGRICRIEALRAGNRLPLGGKPAAGALFLSRRAAGTRIEHHAPVHEMMERKNAGICHESRG
jgi:lipoic acid synthetase